MNQRLTELEARLADLEQALELHAVMLGRLMAMAPGDDERFAWCRDLQRDIRARPTACLSPTTLRLIRAYQFGQSVALPARLDELRPPP